MLTPKNNFSCEASIGIVSRLRLHPAPIGGLREAGGEAGRSLGGRLGERLGEKLEGRLRGRLGERLGERLGLGLRLED